MESIKSENLSRITIDISSEQHQKLKIMSAVKRVSMRKIIISMIDNFLEEEKNNDIKIRNE